MTKLSLVNAEVGSKDTVAEPRVTNALTKIEEFINGKELDGATNIKAASIEEANLTAALVTLINTKSAFALTNVKKNEATFTIASGEFVLMEKEGSEVKLPTATANRIVGIYCVGAAKSITVKAPVVKTITGDFIEEQTTITLTSIQHVILQADGTNWRIIAGEPKREQTYGVETIREHEVEYEASAIRPTLVIFSAPEAAAVIRVGGVAIAEIPTNGSTSFICPPGVKYKVTTSPVLKKYKTSYLTL